jgi:hypothetical protein
MVKRSKTSHTNKSLEIIALFIASVKARNCTSIVLSEISNIIDLGCKSNA